VASRSRQTPPFTNIREARCYSSTARRRAASFHRDKAWGWRERSRRISRWHSGPTGAWRLRGFTARTRMSRYPRITSKRPLRAPRPLVTLRAPGAIRPLQTARALPTIRSLRATRMPPSSIPSDTSTLRGKRSNTKSRSATTWPGFDSRVHPMRFTPSAAHSQYTPPRMRGCAGFRSAWQQTREGRNDSLATRRTDSALRSRLEAHAVRDGARARARAGA